LFACALALFASALQVFVRDVGQILPPLMTFWFFTTPILYSADALPPGLAAAMRYNPMAWYAGRLRDFLLHRDFSLGPADLVVPLLTLVLFGLALTFFRRFSAHFEDFL
jgi:lipopolysaccharide transport system permease protein